MGHAYREYLDRSAEIISSSAEPAEQRLVAALSAKNAQVEKRLRALLAKVAAAEPEEHMEEPEVAAASSELGLVLEATASKEAEEAEAEGAPVSAAPSQGVEVLMISPRPAVADNCSSSVVSAEEEQPGSDWMTASGLVEVVVTRSPRAAQAAVATPDGEWVTVESTPGALQLRSTPRALRSSLSPRSVSRQSVSWQRGASSLRKPSQSQHAEPPWGICLQGCSATEHAADPEPEAAGRREGESRDGPAAAAGSGVGLRARGT